MTIHNTLHKPPALGGKEDAAMQKAGGGLVGSGWVVVFFGWGWGGGGGLESRFVDPFFLE